MCSRERLVALSVVGFVTLQYRIFERQDKTDQLHIRRLVSTVTAIVLPLGRKEPSIQWLGRYSLALCLEELTLTSELKIAMIKLRRRRKQHWQPVIEAEQRRYMEIVCPTSGYAIPIQKGLEAYVNYIADQMLQHEKAFSDMLDAMVVGPPNQSLQVARMFDLSATIAMLLQSALARDKQISMDAVIRTVFEHYGIRLEDAQKFELEARQVTFATLGWATMFFKPVINPHDSEFRTSSAHDQGSVSQKQNPRIIERPIGAMLRALNAMPTLCGIDTSPLSAEPVLPVSSVSYNTLRNMGRVDVIWIDDLSKHGEFMLSKRQLKLFRWPSFCVQAYKRSNTSLLDRLAVS
jgi:hypothetical protein